MDGFQREVFLRAAAERDPSGQRKIRKLRALVCGLNDAPAAFHKTQQHFALNAEELSAFVGLKFRAPPFGPCSYFVLRGGGAALGALTTQIDDVIGRSKPGVLSKVRTNSERRSGDLKVQEQSFVLVGSEAS